MKNKVGKFIIIILVILGILINISAITQMIINIQENFDSNNNGFVGFDAIYTTEYSLLTRYISIILMDVLIIEIIKNAIKKNDVKKKVICLAVFFIILIFIPILRVHATRRCRSDEI